MALRMLQQIRNALSNLNPSEVEQAASRDVTVGLTASSEASYLRMERFLIPADFGGPNRQMADRSVFRTSGRDTHTTYTIDLVEEGLPRANDAFVFYPDDFKRTISEILEKRDEYGLALAMRFPLFREAVSDRVIRSISKENAMFCLATALPDVVPLLSIPLGTAEFASDTAFMTMNQIRMAFLLAAASGKPLGYRQQKGEIASMVAGAFGWRAIARELIGKIPFGGGLIPKAGIAYAGTYVVGLSLERYYRLGYGLNDSEQKAAYHIALDRGKAVASALLEGLKRDKKPPVVHKA